MSKGSRPRPFSVSQEELGKNHEVTFGVKPPKERYVPPPLPDFVEEKQITIWESNNDTKR